MATNGNAKRPASREVMEALVGELRKPAGALLHRDENGLRARSANDYRDLFVAYLRLVVTGPQEGALLKQLEGVEANREAAAQGYRGSPRLTRGREIGVRAWSAACAQFYGDSPRF